MKASRGVKNEVGKGKGLNELGWVGRGVRERKAGEAGSP